MSAIRIQKIISQAGVASRREAERLIRAGAVSINGEIVTEMGTLADPARDAIKVRGKLLSRREEPVYLALNKPRNVLTTMRDEEGKDRPTVAELLPPKRRRVFPVGRLDFDAEGLLLLTNDGDLANRLTHPSSEIPRIYEVKVKGAPGERALRRLNRMAGGKDNTSPESARVRVMGRKAERNTWLRIELREGKHHQVKIMCEAAGHPVLKLVRRSFGGIKMRGLARSEIRTLSEKEVAHLKAITDPDRPKTGKPAPAKGPLPKGRPKASSRPSAAPKRKSASRPKSSQPKGARPKNRPKTTRPKASSRKKAGTRR
jgi:23S rRNA pseudouridine2605 synthase